MALPGIHNGVASDADATEVVIQVNAARQTAFDCVVQDRDRVVCGCANPRVRKRQINAAGPTVVRISSPGEGIPRPELLQNLQQFKPRVLQSSVLNYFRQCVNY